ncbi:hypothetical protein NUSPORA_00189 [Nucleospora cyclopteri]
MIIILFSYFVIFTYNLMKFLLENEDVTNFYIVNKSGGMIFRLKKIEDTNKDMIFCSTMHSLIEIGQKMKIETWYKEENNQEINDKKNKNVQKSPLMKNISSWLSALNVINPDNILNHKTSEYGNNRLIIDGENGSINIFKTLTNLVFIFISKEKFKENIFEKVYQEFSDKIMANPFYKIDQPINNFPYFLYN